MKPSTYFALLAEFGTAHVPIVEVARKYFGYEEKKAKGVAASGNFPFPVFRAGGQKSPWLVDIADLADYIDKARNKAQQQKNLITTGLEE